MVEDDTGFVVRRVSARDGLRLAGRDHGPRESERLPVVCLPGLTRTAADFHELATALATQPGEERRVLSLDYRGRGESEWDRKWANYDVRVEADDCLSFLAAMGVERAVFVGTSRGGLITMAIGAMRAASIAGVVLNDIGPVIDPRGLIRIRGYVGKMPRPRDIPEAVDILRRVQGAQFPAASDADWERFARRSFREVGGKLEPAYDPALMKPLAALDLEAPFPALWHLFDGLAGVPVMVLRGALSDLLAPETVKAMAGRHPDCEVLTVEGQGHAPLLGDAPTIARIAAFVRRVEARTHG